MHDGRRLLRRVSWFGIKRHFKGVLGLRPINLPLVAILSRLPGPPHWVTRLPVNTREVRCAVDGQAFYMCEPMECNIAKEIYWAKGALASSVDRTALTVFCRLAAEADVVLDIGASTGLFSLAAGSTNPALEIHAFEIVPEVFSLLFRNVARNNLASRCECHFCGVGTDSTVALMPLHTGGSSLPTALSTKTRFSSGVRVRFRSLDSLVGLAKGTRRVLAKIDVEGTENEVLHQAHLFVTRHCPDMLCEVLPGSAAEEVQGFLDLHGYRALRVEERGVRDLRRIVPCATYRDWLFTRKATDELVRLGVHVVA